MRNQFYKLRQENPSFNKILKQIRKFCLFFAMKRKLLSIRCKNRFYREKYVLKYLFIHLSVLLRSIFYDLGSDSAVDRWN